MAPMATADHRAVTAVTLNRSTARGPLLQIYALPGASFGGCHPHLATRGCDEELRIRAPALLPAFAAR